VLADFAEARATCEWLIERGIEQVAAGYAPQLPLEALIAARATGFDAGRLKGKATRLSYWRLRGVQDGGAIEDVLVARKLVETVGAPVTIHGRELSITPSIGVAIHPEHGATVHALITNADAAMYHVKKAGRNAVRVFAPDMSTFFPDRLAMENDLRKALDRHEMELHYQPKFNLRSGDISGMEALVRWRHPDHGLLLPGEFIPLAEEIGFIAPLGRWVLREACRQNKLWQEEGLTPLRVAVNISAAQLREDDFPDSVALALRETRLDPRYLEIEITESVVMQHASAALLVLDRLSHMGIHLAIDDFGTGYSSLSYLKRFPIKTLKIDRSFIQDLPNQSDALIVEAIQALGRSLKLQVVAEGVETQAQLEFLKSHGNGHYQGFLGGRPVPAAEFRRLLESGWEAPAVAPARA